MYYFTKQCAVYHISQKYILKSHNYVENFPKMLSSIVGLHESNFKTEYDFDVISIHLCAYSICFLKIAEIIYV